jgi:hypothetical protein
MDEKRDFENRLKGAYINKNGMICLGWNKIHKDSPFGRELLKNNPNIKVKDE